MSQYTNCRKCGERMLHNRHKGTLEFATVDLVFECSSCDNEERLMILTDEEQAKAKKWQDAIDRMTYGRVRPENTDAPETVPVEDILDDDMAVMTEDASADQTPDMSGRKPDGYDQKLDNIIDSDDNIDQNPGENDGIR